MKQLELFPSEAAGTDHRAAQDRLMRTLPVRELDATLRRFRYAEAWEGLPPGRRGDADLGGTIKAVGLDHDDADPPSIGTVRRWVAQLRRADGHPIGLVDRRVATLRPPIEACRTPHLSCGHPLGEVVVGRETLRLGVPELCDGPVYLMTARDTYSGVIVAAALGTAEPDGSTMLSLFGVRPGSVGAPPRGAVRMCAGIPEALLLDQGCDFRAGSFRDAAAALGVTLVFATGGDAGCRRRSTALTDWLAATGREVRTPDGLWAVVQAWLSHQDVRRSGPGGRTPLDLWQEGLARYGMRPAPSSTDRGSDRAGGRDGSGDLDAPGGR